MKLLKEALIYDGSGADAFLGDILIENDRIVKVESNITPEDGWEVVDLKGLSVSPGFTDAHSHNDWFAIKSDPQKYFEPFIRQGITSFVTGNCGLSSVGFEAQSQHVDKIGGGFFSHTDTTGVYTYSGRAQKNARNNGKVFDRGCLWSFLTVFDEMRLRDGQPDQEQSFGIEQVYLNGIKVLDGDVLDTDAIKHSGRAMNKL